MVMWLLVHQVVVDIQKNKEEIWGLNLNEWIW